MTTFNSAVSQIGLSATVIGHEQINSSVNFNSNTLFPNHYHINFTPFPYPNSLIVYIFPTTNSGGGIGYAQVGYPVMGIRSDYLTSKSTFAHEFGHVCGLYHTRWGTMYNVSPCDTVRGELKDGCIKLKGIKNYSQKPEYVDNTRINPISGKRNGEEAGDYIMDTPANPSASGRIDEYGQTYTTIGNVMDWSFSSLYSYTSNQKQVIQKYLEDPVFSRIFTKSISGPIAIFNGNTGTFT